MTYVPLKTIQISNFQSIKDATIELGRLTVLVGPGDAGKSAILRAFRAVCLNDGNDEDIRHGEKKTQVTLTFEDGTVIEWWKDKGKGGCYRAFGQEYNKTGGAVPEDIAKYLGIGQIEIDSTSELTPQLSDQHDSPFVLWETGSKRARILGKATRLDTVVSAQMSCKKEIDQARRESGEAATTLVEVEERLKALPNYQTIEQGLAAAEGDLSTITSSIQRAERAQELANQIAAVRSRGATTFDVAPLRGRLQEAGEALARVITIKTLGNQIPELQRSIEEFGKRATDHRISYESFQEQYQTACVEAGACPVCGGLLTHKECTI
jgi:DNA repair ATPase RecN